MARILVIEDNEANLELMTYLFEAFGHVTFSATDGATGVERARTERPDMIICDVRIPKIDGLGVARLLKRDAATTRIPLLAVTAFARVSDRDAALVAGFDGFIAKPIDPETFVTQVESFLHVSPDDPTSDR